LTGSSIHQMRFKVKVMNSTAYIWMLLVLQPITGGIIA